MDYNVNAWVKEEVFRNECKCLRFAAGGYEALMVTNIGANIIELKDNTRGISVFRTPDSDEGFKVFKFVPQVYGLPVLFPPNRIEDGIFKVGNRVYKFPINEPDRNNFIHGFIKDEKWDITRKEIFNDEVLIEAAFNFDEKHKFYKYFPHKFRFKLLYNLSKEGLKQTVSVINLSKEEMPLAVGFHAAFNIPFHPESRAEDYRVIASVDKRWEQNERLLPTGKQLELSGYETGYLGNGVVPLKQPIESHYSLKHIKFNGCDFKGAIIEDTFKKIRVVYKMGEEYKHTVIWNDEGDKNYICLEPQTSAINAPNLKLDKSVTGFKTLMPKEEWSEVCKISVEDIK